STRAWPRRCRWSYAIPDDQHQRYPAGGDDNAGSHGTRMECEAMARKSEAVRSLPAEVGRRSLRREGCTEHGGVLQNIFSRAQPLRVADLPSDFERTDAAARRERLPYPGS